MSSAVKLSVEARSHSGTGAARATRREGKVPATIYGDKKDPSDISVDENLILKELETPGIYSRLFSISDGKAETNAVIRDIQLHPVTDRPLHVDFQRVQKSSTIIVDVRLRVENEATCNGLKRGGVLNAVRHSVKLKCAAENIPAYISVDIAKAQIGTSIHISDLPLPEGSVLHHTENPKTTLMTLVPPKVRGKQGQSDSESGEEASDE